MLTTVAVVAVCTVSADAARAEPELVMDRLAFPTNMALATDGRLFFTEKETGDVRIIRDGRLLPMPFDHLDVIAGGETGLLGIALHPTFPNPPWVYVSYSDALDGRNRMIRILADGDVGTRRQNLIDGLSAANGYHNGGDIAFATDGSLFLSVGEAHEPERAQDPNDIGGKVVRIEANGTLAPDNPFGPDNPVYSVGHRNSFGLCVDPATGDLWETENGPGSSDEVNLVTAGANYGWPEQLGPGGAPPYVDPVVTYPEVIVPTGCAVWDGDLYVGSYASGMLHRIRLPAEPGAAVDHVVARFDHGITDVAAGPNGDLYVATSDAIWRFAGDPGAMPAIPTPPAASRPPDAAAPGPGAPAEEPRPLARVVAVAVAIGAGAGLLFAAARRRSRRSRTTAEPADR